MSPRLLAAGCLVAFASSVSARGEDAPPERVPLKHLRAEAGAAYEASRAVLAERGKKASSAADAGDYVAWKEANAAYLEGLVDLELVCENAVRDISSKPSDLPNLGFKAVFDALTPYLKAAGPLLESRLRLKAYTELLPRTSPEDRRAALAALVPVYFTGE